MIGNNNARDGVPSYSKGGLSFWRDEATGRLGLQIATEDGTLRVAVFVDADQEAALKAFCKGAPTVEHRGVTYVVDLKQPDTIVASFQEPLINPRGNWGPDYLKGKPLMDAIDIQEAAQRVFHQPADYADPEVQRERLRLRDEIMQRRLGGMTYDQWARQFFVAEEMGLHPPMVSMLDRPE